MQLSTLGRLAWALQAEEAVLLALAPDGGDAIQEIAAAGDGPTTRQLDADPAKASSGPGCASHSAGAGSPVARRPTHQAEPSA